MVTASCFLLFQTDEEQQNSNLDTFHVDSGAHKLFYQQHRFAVAARYGTADFNVVGFALICGEKQQNE